MIAPPPTPARAAIFDLSVVIISYNTRDLLARCLDVLLAAGDEAALALEIIVVDNGSVDGSVELLAARYPSVRTIRNPVNRGFAAANNVGLRHIQAPVALLLNSDAFVTASALRRGLELLHTQERVGLVGVRLLNEDGTLQAEWGDFPTLMDDIRTSVGLDRLTRRRSEVPARVGPVDWVQGACLFVRADALAEVGGLDEAFFMYSEEVDWCRAFWARQWEVWYLGDVAIVHLGGASSRNHDVRRRVALYRSRLGMRRRLSGPSSSVVLWVCMIAGLGARIAVRQAAQSLARRQLGRQSPGGDWALVREVSRMDPLARWATA